MTPQRGRARPRDVSRPRRSASASSPAARCDPAYLDPETRAAAVVVETRRWLDRFPRVDVDKAIAVTYGDLRRRRAALRAGSSAENDLWIAATAQTLGVPIVTCDKAFLRHGASRRGGRSICPQPLQRGDGDTVSGRLPTRAAGRRRAGSAESPAVPLLKSSSGSAPRCSSTRRLGYGVAARAAGEAAAQPPRDRHAARRKRAARRRRLRGAELRVDAALPSVTLIVAAYDEEAVIADKVANVRALDYPRDRLEIVVACDGSPDATPSARATAGADLVLDLPRGGKIRAQDAGGRARAAARSSPSPTRTPSGSPTRCARSSRRSRDPEVGYVCGQVRVRQRRRARTRRASTGATRWRCAALESRLASRHRRQRRDLRDAPRGLHRGRPDHGPRPLVPVQHGQARLARGLRAGRARDGEDGPDDRGRVRAQAADDEPRLADRPARRDAVAARLPPALRADDRLAPRAALRGAVPAPGRAASTNVAARCAAAGSTRSRSPRSCLLVAAAALARCDPGAPLLVARYYVLTTASLGGRPVGLAAPRRPRPAGSRRRGTR